MADRILSPSLQRRIRQRANFLCEYCHTSKKWQYVSFTVDHIVPTSQGGSNEADNLALACFHCNRHKSDRITAVDPQSGQEIPLFNPRQHDWNEHSIWSSDGLHIVPLTAIGRAAINALKLNRERVIPIRADDLAVNRHPPIGDRILVG